MLLGNTELRVYRIKRDRDIERHMFELAHSFWVEHVLTKRPRPPRLGHRPSRCTRPQTLGWNSRRVTRP